MKTVSLDLKKNAAPLWIHKKFMNCMRVAVRLRDLKSLDNWFRIVVTIFCSPFKTNRFIEANDSMKEMVANVAENIKNDIVEDADITEEELTKLEGFHETFVLESQIQPGGKKRIFKDSPFYNRFGTIYDTLIEYLKIPLNTTGNCSKNGFYFPDFIEEILLNKYMPIVCFWSNLIVKYVYPDIDVIANARVEIYFRLVKHNIFDHELHQRISVFMRKKQANTYSKLEMIDGIHLEDVYATRGGLRRAEDRRKQREKQFQANDEWYIPENLDIESDVWKSRFAPRSGRQSHLFQKNINNMDRAILPVSENDDHVSIYVIIYFETVIFLYNLNKFSRMLLAYNGVIKMKLAIPIKIIVNL